MFVNKFPASDRDEVFFSESETEDEEVPEVVPVVVVPKDKSRQDDVDGESVSVPAKGQVQPQIPIPSSPSVPDPVPTPDHGDDAQEPSKLDGELEAFLQNLTQSAEAVISHEQYVERKAQELEDLLDVSIRRFKIKLDELAQEDLQLEQADKSDPEDEEEAGT